MIQAPFDMCRATERATRASSPASPRQCPVCAQLGNTHERTWPDSSRQRGEPNMARFKSSTWRAEHGPIQVVTGASRTWPDSSSGTGASGPRRCARGAARDLGPRLGAARFGAANGLEGPRARGARSASTTESWCACYARSNPNEGACGGVKFGAATRMNMARFECDSGVAIRGGEPRDMAAFGMCTGSAAVRRTGFVDC